MGEEIYKYGRQEWHMLVMWVHRFFEGRERVYEWKAMNGSREELKWDVRKWKSEIDKAVKGVGLSKWKTKLERKKTLEWYRKKEAPMYVRWYNGSLGDLFRARAQYIDVNARNYRWSEFHSKVCQMCDMGDDETVEHVILEFEKHDRERMKMMRVILTEM